MNKVKIVTILIVSIAFARSSVSANGPDGPEIDCDWAIHRIAELCGEIEGLRNRISELRSDYSSCTGPVGGLLSYILFRRGYCKRTRAALNRSVFQFDHAEMEKARLEEYFDSGECP